MITWLFRRRLPISQAHCEPTRRVASCISVRPSRMPLSVGDRLTRDVFNILQMVVLPVVHVAVVVSRERSSPLVKGWLTSSMQA